MAMGVHLETRPSASRTALTLCIYNLANLARNTFKVQYHSPQSTVTEHSHRPDRLDRGQSVEQ